MWLLVFHPLLLVDSRRLEVNWGLIIDDIVLVKVMEGRIVLPERSTSIDDEGAKEKIHSSRVLLKLKNQTQQHGKIRNKCQYLNLCESVYGRFYWANLFYPSIRGLAFKMVAHKGMQARRVNLMEAALKLRSMKESSWGRQTDRKKERTVRPRCALGGIKSRRLLRKDSERRRLLPINDRKCGWFTIW